MKKIVICFGLLCLAAIAAIWGGMYFINSGFLSAKISQNTQEATGAPLNLTGKTKLSLFPLAISIGSGSWQMPDKGGNALNTRVTFQAARIEPELLPLLHGQLIFKEIFLDKPHVVIRMPAKAVHTARQDASPQTQAADDNPGNVDLPLPEIDRITVQGGTLRLEDSSIDTELANINLSVENLRRKQEADLKCDFGLSIFQKGGSDTPEHQGNMAFRAKLRYYTPNLTFRQAALTYTSTRGDIPPWLSPVRISFEGAANLANLHFNLASSTISLPNGQASLNGEGKLAPTWFKGKFNMEIAPPDKDSGSSAPLLSLKSASEFEDFSLKMNDLAINVAGASGTGNLLAILPHGAIPLKIEGDLVLGAVHIDRLLPLFEKRTAQRQEINKGSSAAGWPEIRLGATLDELDYGKIKLLKPALKLHGTDGYYQLDKFSCDFANGKITVDAGANMAAGTFYLNANASGIEPGQALAQFGLNEFEGGEASFRANFKAEGFDSATIVTTLNGSGHLSARNTRIKILESLNKILSFMGKSEAAIAGDNQVECNFSVDNGLARIAPLEITAKGLQAKGTATCNLRDSQIEGSADFKIFGFNLPLSFKGTPGNIRLVPTSALFHNLGRPLP